MQRTTQYRQTTKRKQSLLAARKHKPEGRRLAAGGGDIQSSRLPLRKLMESEHGLPPPLAVGHREMNQQVVKHRPCRFVISIQIALGSSMLGMASRRIAIQPS